MDTNFYFFIDTESIIYNDSRVVYDLSISLVKYMKHSCNFSKELRNRTISNIDESFSTIYEKNIIIYEYAHLIPESKKHMYGYANYQYMKFDEAIEHLQFIFKIFKPDCIIGYNFQSDIEALKSTQNVLKTSKLIYSNNVHISSGTLFKKNVCIEYDKTIKCDLMLYLTNHCPKFMKQQEEFSFEHNLVTKSKYISQKLVDMYRYVSGNPNIEQVHMGYYDNMYSIKCLKKSLQTDGSKYFPIHCMSENNRKRKHIDSFNDNNEIIIEYKSHPLPNWFNDQYKNSKCSKNESLLDIRKFHPDFGGNNSNYAPYFRGKRTREGIWPPDYVKNKRQCNV